MICCSANRLRFIYGARNNVLSNKRDYLNAILNLCQALGGAWSSTGPWASSRASTCI